MGWCPCRILISRFGGRPARFFPSTKQLRPANSLNIRRRVGKAGDWLSLHRSSACASAGDGAPRRPRSHPDYLAGGDGHSPGLHSTPCIGEVSRRRCLPVRRRAATSARSRGRRLDSASRPRAHGSRESPIQNWRPCRMPAFRRRPQPGWTARTAVASSTETRPARVVACRRVGMMSPGYLARSEPS